MEELWGYFSYKYKIVRCHADKERRATKFKPSLGLKKLTYETASYNLAGCQTPRPKITKTSHLKLDIIAA